MLSTGVRYGGVGFSKKKIDRLLLHYKEVRICSGADPAGLAHQRGTSMRWRANRDEGGQWKSLVRFPEGQQVQGQVENATISNTPGPNWNQKHASRRCACLIVLNAEERCGRSKAWIRLRLLPVRVHGPGSLSVVPTAVGSNDCGNGSRLTHRWSLATTREEGGHVSECRMNAATDDSAEVIGLRIHTIVSNCIPVHWSAHR